MTRDELIEELKKAPDGDVKIEARFTDWCVHCRTSHEVCVEIRPDRVRTVPIAIIEAIE